MSIIDYILPEDQEQYKAIIRRAAEAKANAPKAVRERKPLTTEQKIVRDEKKLTALQEKLEALKASLNN